MIKSPTLHGTERFDTSLPAVVRKCNTPCCVVEEISICVTGATAISQSWRPGLCRRIYKSEGLSRAVCSGVVPAGREKSIIDVSSMYGPHVFHSSSSGAFDVTRRLPLCEC